MDIAASSRGLDAHDQLRVPEGMADLAGAIADGEMTACLQVRADAGGLPKWFWQWRCA